MLSLVGISHRHAPVDVRERVALDARGSAALARELGEADGDECVCLSTCNRTELYVAGPGIEERAVGVLEPEAAGSLYRRRDDAAARHLFRVTAGLDSRVRGETEILGQVRAAYALGAPGPLLDRLFREALRVGRKVRAQTPVGDPRASAASAAAVLAERVLGDLAGRTVLIVGAGEIGSRTAARLAARGARIGFVANRRVGRRLTLARELGAVPLALEDAGEALGAADVVIASTGSPGLVLTRAQVERALASRERRPLLLIDLAVPRDVDPEIAGLPYAFLYDVDDLHEAVGAGTAAGAAARAEAIVAEEAERFRAWQASRGVVPAIAALRAKAEGIRARELDRAGRRLADLSDDERSAVEAVTAQIVNKLLHDPTVRLKDAAAGAEGAAFADAVRHLFALDRDADPGRQPR
jgi:glutamyl-tRNA reductase